MTDHDRVRHIVERDIYRRMNQIGGTLHLAEMTGGALSDLVLAVHNELSEEQTEGGVDICQYWLVSDHLGERMARAGFCLVETEDGWFYARTTAGTGLEDDITSLLKREESNDKG